MVRLPDWLEPARRATVLRYGVPVVCTLALWTLLAAASALVAGVRLSPIGVAVDLGFHVLLALAVAALARRVWLAVVVLGVTTGVLTAGNVAKIAILGAPLLPDDLDGVGALVEIAPRWFVFAAVAIGFVFVGGLAAAVTLRRPAARVAVLGFAGVAGAVWAAPGIVTAGLDAAFGHSHWNQRANYEARGPLLNFVMESARHGASVTAAPGAGAVASAAGRLAVGVGGTALAFGPAAPHPLIAAGLAPQRRPGRTGFDTETSNLATTWDRLVPPPGRARRNLHVVVLESFWDASALGAVGPRRDPFDPRFRALWEASGRSRALSPVFGGQTANAEFEALCGFPVLQAAVFFESGLRRDVPCLPRVLADDGYLTVASHPNVPAFWNRVNAYRRLGFTLYRARNDFAMNDMINEFMSDRSLYAQMGAELWPAIESGRPVFNYMLTIYGHLGYPVDERRPVVMPVGSSDDLVARYVSTAYHKTVELMDFLDELAIRDPDAVVVVFGDHLPYLGTAYADAGLFAENFGEMTPSMLIERSATPLLVVDGRNGPLRLGDLPIYRLPSLILDLLGEEATTVMDLTEPPGAATLRPLPGMIVVGEAGGGLACPVDSQEPACAEALAWRARVATVSADLFAGGQHVLALLPQILPPHRSGRPRWAGLGLLD